LSPANVKVSLAGGRKKRDNRRKEEKGQGRKKRDNSRTTLKMSTIFRIERKNKRQVEVAIGFSKLFLKW